MSALVVPTGSLAEITDHLQALFDTLEGIDDPKVRKEAEREIEEYLERETAKVDNVNAYLDTCEQQQAAAKAQIEKLRDRMAMWEKREQRVRAYVASVMERFGKRKLEGKTSSFSLRAAPPSVIITDEAAIPEAYKRTTVSVSIDKTAIRRAIEAGQDVAGADLAMGKMVVVRK